MHIIVPATFCSRILEILEFLGLKTDKRELYRNNETNKEKSTAQNISNFPKIKIRPIFCWNRSAVKNETGNQFSGNSWFLWTVWSSFSIIHTKKVNLYSLEPLKNAKNCIQAEISFGMSQL